MGDVKAYALVLATGPEVWVAIIGGLFALVAAVVAGVSAIRQLATERQYAVDAALREMRLKHYAGAWRALEPLSRYQGKELYASDLRAMKLKLSGWYYQEGGIYLTMRSRAALTQCLKAIDAAEVAGGKVDDHVKDVLFSIGSAFRTHMTLDLGGRFEPRLASPRYQENRAAADREILRALRGLRDGGLLEFRGARPAPLAGSEEVRKQALELVNLARQKGYGTHDLILFIENAPRDGPR